MPTTDTAIDDLFLYPYTQSMKRGTGLILFVLVSHAMYSQKNPLFELVPPALSGVNFKNTLEESPTANVLTYEYFYNGGGVAIGDINNDGLEIGRAHV